MAAHHYNLEYVYVPSVPQAPRESGLLNDLQQLGNWHAYDYESWWTYNKKYKVEKKTVNFIIGIFKSAYETKWKSCQQ